MDLERELDFARGLCDAADEITLRHFRAAGLVVDTKPDLTPVTDADREVERVIRDRLAQERPRHRMLGEEAGESGPPDSAWRWLVDPIDGTKNFVRGVPVYATLLALQHGEETVLGVVSAPALGRRWWAARGMGAFATGDAVNVSSVGEFGDAFVAYDDVLAFERIGVASEFGALARRCWRVRGYSDFWPHAMVAEGSIDAAIYAEPGLKPWDVAALQVLVEEAGGRFSALAGGDWKDGASALSSNGLLHDGIVAALNV